MVCFGDYTTHHLGDYSNPIGGIFISQPVEWKQKHGNLNTVHCISSVFSMSCPQEIRRKIQELRWHLGQEALTAARLVNFASWLRGAEDRWKWTEDRWRCSRGVYDGLLTQGLGLMSLGIFDITRTARPLLEINLFSWVM